MDNKRSNGMMNRARRAALAATVGLASLLPMTTPSAHAGQPFGGFGGIGYKAEAQKASYDEVIKRVSTPAEAIAYRDNCLPYEKDIKTYGKGDYWASFKQIHAKGKDDCDGVSTAMAALLADDGYKPQILFLTKPVSGVEKMFARQSGDIERAEKTDDDYHTVFPYQDKKTGKWGCIGVGRSEDRDPKYDTLEAMVKSLKVGWQYYGYAVDTKAFDNGMLDLDKQYGRENWVAGDMNLKGTSKEMIARSISARDGSAQKPKYEYNPKAFMFMSDQIRKIGYKVASKESLVSMAVSQGIERSVAERHFDMARTRVEDEVKGWIALVEKAKAEKAMKDAAKNGQLATTDSK